MKIIQIKNKPLRAFAIAIGLPVAIALGITILGALSYAIGLVSPYAGDLASTRDIAVCGFMTILSFGVVGGLLCLATISCNEWFKSKIKNRLPRFITAFLGGLAIFVAGLSVMTVGVYVLGLVSPLAKVIKPCDAGEVWATGFATLLGAAIAGLILWGLYEAGRALYHGPCDP